MLSLRLLTLASLINEGDIVADIGSDHGLLPRYLVTKGHTYVYASENKVGPYTRLKQSVDPQFVEVDLADGIENLPSRINTLVIAGMGGTLTAKILKKDAPKLVNIKKMVLAPQGALPLVRETLIYLGYTLTYEAVVAEDGKYYDLLVALQGQSPTLTADELIFGPINLANRTHPFLSRIEAEYQRNEDLLRKNISGKRRQYLETQQQTLRRVKGDKHGNT